MSKEYLITADLSNKFSDTSCRQLLKKGKELELIYLNSSFYKTQFPNEILSINEASHVALEQRNSLENAPQLYFKLFDTFGKFIFSVSSNEKFSLILEPGNWKQFFFTLLNRSRTNEHIYIDQARYARLLLDLIEGLYVENYRIDNVEDAEYFKNLPPNHLGARIINKDDICIRLVWNIYLNQSLIIPSINSSILFTQNAAMEYLATRFPLYSPSEFYIKNSDTLSKLTISENSIILYPLEPVRKKSIDGIPVRDAAFYIRLLLGICEEYPILEFKTSFQD